MQTQIYGEVIDLQEKQGNQGKFQLILLKNSLFNRNNGDLIKEQTFPILNFSKPLKKVGDKINATVYINSSERVDEESGEVFNNLFLTLKAYELR